MEMAGTVDQKSEDRFVWCAYIHRYIQYNKIYIHNMMIQVVT